MDDLLPVLSSLLGRGVALTDDRARAIIYAVLAVSVAWLIWTIRPRRYAVHNLPGPARPGWLLGNVEQIADAEAGDFLDDLFAKHGPTVVFADLFGKTRVASIDPAFVNHILRDSITYRKDDRTQSLVRLYAPGSGVFSAEGEMHKRQRRVIVPVFSPKNIAQFHPLFLEKSYELRDKLLGGTIATSGSEIDVLDWTRRLTFDIISVAAFDYPFDSIHGSDNELYRALHRAFDVTDTNTPWVFMQTFFPILRRLRTPSGRVFLHLERLMNKIAKDIVRKKKAAVLDAAKAEGKSEVDKETVEGNNVIAKIVRANLAADVPASQRLSDTEVADQVGTFLLAGSVTTATAIAWMLYALAKDPQIQTKLREELLAIPDDKPNGATLNELPYFDAVTRETLRLYCPVADVAKVCTKTSDVVPLSTPIVGRDGSSISEVVMEKGVEVMISPVNINRSKAVWGEDAHEFRPERWLHESPVPEAAKSYDSAWGHLLTFSAGPRSCLGFRFAIEELKAMTFVLVRAFTYALPVPEVEIHRFSMFAQTPKIKGKLQGGDRMPLILSPYVASTA